VNDSFNPPIFYCRLNGNCISRHFQV
jgi:hypothetical protein